MKRLLILQIGIILVPAAGRGYTVPAYFEQSPYRSGTGVGLYRTLSAAPREYVLVVQLNQGGGIQLRNGTIRSGVRGFEPISRYSLESDWSSFSTSSSLAFAVTNGAFFSANDCDDYTDVGIAFSLKIDQYMVAYGYGNNNEYIGQKRAWKIWGNESAISSFNDDYHSIVTCPRFLYQIS